MTLSKRMLNLTFFVFGLFALLPACSSESVPIEDAKVQRLVNSAMQQIGQTLIYDGSYQKLEYPNGDVPRKRGVCTDVIVRALRDSHQIDLQVLVHEDMRAHFSAYPPLWGLKRPDKNIDHRRVPNLRRYFERQKMDLGVSQNAADYLPGDIVTWRLDNNLTHIGIVSAQKTWTGTPLMIHNIGMGTQIEDMLFDYQITGHYRYFK